MRRSWLIVGALLGLAHPAAATYSIVGADTATQEIGGSGTSCVDGSDVYIIYGSAPGFGVVHAQALANEEGRDYAVELLEQGLSPQEIIDEITSPDFDSNADSRQYGVADVMGRTAGFTGANANDYAGDVQGQVGSFSYSLQGNILTSAAVISQAANAFEASGCDLAERLMLALEAGADNGEGDNRCTDDGRPSDSAYLQVDRPGEPAGDYLELRVPTTDANPLIELRALYDDWRETHPCPEPNAGGSGGASGAGGGDAGGNGGAAGNASAGASAGMSGAGGRGGSGGQASGGQASGGAGSGQGGAAEPAASSAEDAGCACRTRPVRTSGWPALLCAALVVIARRRRV